MRSILICNDLWDYTCEKIEKTSENQITWETKDGKALAIILLCVSTNQLNHIKKAESSAAAWKSLEKLHESKGLRKATLYKQIYRLKKDSNQTMTEYVHSFQRKLEQLEEVGMKIPQDLQSVMLLNSLPPEYESFCIAIELRDDLPTVESLKSKLIEQEARHLEQVSKNNNENNALSVKEKRRDKHDPQHAKKNYPKHHTQKFDGSCYNCGKVRHRAINCRAKKKDNTANMWKMLCQRL